MGCGRVHCRWPGTDGAGTPLPARGLPLCRAGTRPLGRQGTLGIRGRTLRGGGHACPVGRCAGLPGRPRPSSCAGLGRETAGRCAGRSGARSPGPEDLAARERLTVDKCDLRLMCLPEEPDYSSASPAANLAPNQRPGPALLQAARWGWGAGGAPRALGLFCAKPPEEDWEGGGLVLPHVSWETKEEKSFLKRSRDDEPSWVAVLFEGTGR